MLVEFPRVTQSEQGEALRFAVNPVGVNCVIDGEEPDTAIIRLSDGRGVSVRVPYSVAKQELARHVHLVEFDRPGRAETSSYDDDGDSSDSDDPSERYERPSAPVRKIAVNPQFVTAFFQSAREEAVTVIRFPAGSGFKVKADFEAVRRALSGEPQGAPTLLVDQSSQTVN